MQTDLQKYEVAKQMSRLWEPLNDEQRSVLVEQMIIVHPNRGEAFFRIGDEPLYMHYLLKGSVAIYQHIDNSRYHLVRMVEPGSIFGAQSAFSSEYYKFEAIAGANTEAVLIPLPLTYHLVWESPGFALAFIQELSSLLGTSVEHTIHLTHKHIRGRLAETILRMKDKYGTTDDGNTLNIMLSRNDLAMMSNMTTSNAIRTLSAFATEGIIAIKGRSISIVQEEELKRISRME